LKPRGNNQLERAVVLTLTIKLVGAVLLKRNRSGHRADRTGWHAATTHRGGPTNSCSANGRVYVALCPAETEADADPPVGTASPILGATAVPVSVTVCGLFPASSVMVSVRRYSGLR
jgi:hypothetical protein